MFLQQYAKFKSKSTAIPVTLETFLLRFKARLLFRELNCIYCSYNEFLSLYCKLFDRTHDGKCGFSSFC